MTMLDALPDARPPTLPKLAGRVAAMRRISEAVAASDEDDARAILGLILEDLGAGEPAPGFEEVEIEAENWAALAAYDELRAYFFAIGERLKHQMLGKRGQMRLASRLMSGLSADDRATVLTSLNLTEPVAPRPSRASERPSDDL